MTQNEMFGSALWLGSPDSSENTILALRGRFSVTGAESAVLRFIGLGFCHCYINGQRVSEDWFLPLNTDYEPREDFPVGETVTGHRIYALQYDILPLLRDGENVIAIHFGGGWYTYGQEHPFGQPKVIWSITGTDESGSFAFASSCRDRIAESYVKGYAFTYFEGQDHTSPTVGFEDPAYDDSSWAPAQQAAAPQTEYHFTDCPADRLGESLAFTAAGSDPSVMDCGLNTTALPCLELTGQAGERVSILFSEELTEDGQPDERFAHRQHMELVCGGENRLVTPLFTWFGFRYMKITGPAVLRAVYPVHSAVAVTSSFVSDNELMNWIHDTYLNTQLTNMHAGIPSDCPHIERRGYTGDGQLTCHAAMNMLDARSFYGKWIQDIIDCQDVHTGHVQYTAPYTRSGGGPGGWGSAIVEVPYQYYLHYGDAEPLKRCYPGMLRYFDYLEDHSQGDLVISDKPGEWCLGDWCTPISVILPAPFVNNYFYIKALTRCLEIAPLVGREEDTALFRERIDRRKQAIMAAYFNSWDGNFLGNQQGANAFALDIGLGDERTYGNMVAYYRQLGRFDTGIFGTDIVTRLLFERGDGQLAADLLLSEADTSFSGMRRAGATTLWEYWPGSLRDRSHNHPMFGAAVACLYDHLLGIQAAPSSPGYKKLQIRPVLVDQIQALRGSRTLPIGKVIIHYEKFMQTVDFTVSAAPGVWGELCYGGNTVPIWPGVNRYSFTIV